MQLTDSAFPVGGFSFSNGLETAAADGIVRDAASLEAYTRTLMRQSATTDSVAALAAWHAHRTERLDGAVEADSLLAACRFPTETRQMLRRMGRKCAELGVLLTGDPQLKRFLAAIAEERTAGCYPVVQGLLFSAAGLTTEMLVTAQQYGMASQTLAAALRCIRVSHIDTQRILHRLATGIPSHYAEARATPLTRLNSFSPQADILAAMHEKGLSRMFMN